MEHGFVQYINTALRTVGCGITLNGGVVNTSGRCVRLNNDQCELSMDKDEMLRCLKLDIELVRRS